MAVRRISDLPELSSNYPDAQLSNCLIEVSYTPRNAVYQSFYAKMDYVLGNIASNLPKATKSQFGVVKVGSNIDVVEDGPDKGLISVPVATRSKAGVFQLPGPDWPYVATDSNGNFIRTSAPTVSTPVSISNYDVLNMIYPIGSLYMTTNNDDPVPPDFDSFIAGTDNKKCKSTAKDTSNKHITWQKLDTDKTLWTSNSNLGESLSPTLPKLPTWTCNSAGSHTHAVAFESYSGSTSVEGSGHHADAVVATGGGGAIYNPYNENKWSTAEKNGKAQYVTLRNDKGFTTDEIKELAGITGSSVSESNFKYGVFYDSNALKNYMAANPNAKLTTTIIDMTNAAGLSQTTTNRFKPIQYIKNYLKLQYYTIPIAKGRMENTGAHTHTLTPSTGSSSIYSSTNDTLVRPNSIAVAIWQRIANS